MQKIVITGISGTGKSVFGCKLAARSGLPLFHMDAMIWCPNWTEASYESISVALAGVTATHRWIVEGWIDTYSRQLLQDCDVIVYLDYPGWLAAFGGVQRWWKHEGNKRPEMAQGCIEDFSLDFLKTMLLRKERPHIEAILNEFPHLNVVRSRSRSQTEKLLMRLGPSTGR